MFLFGPDLLGKPGGTYQGVDNNCLIMEVITDSGVYGAPTGATLVQSTPDKIIWQSWAVRGYILFSTQCFGQPLCKTRDGVS